MNFTVKKIGAAMLAPVALFALSACGSGNSAGSPASSSKAATGSSAPAKLTTVSYRLDWIPVGYEAPFVYGAKTGIYKKYGINLQWSYGTGSADTAKQVATGKVMFGNGDANSVLKLIASGVKMKMIYGYMQENPDAVIFPASENIKSPKDLVNVTVGASPGSSTLLLFPAMLKTSGVNPSSVKIDSMEASQKVPALFSKKVGAIIDYGFEVQPELAAQGLKTNVLNYANYGVNPINLGIVATDQTIKNDPKLVQNFVNATTAAIKAAEAHPNAAVQAIIDSANGTAPSKSILLSQWQYTMKHLLQTPNDKGHPLGWMSSKDWTDTQNLSVTYLGLKTALSPSDAYTNQFIK